MDKVRQPSNHKPPEKPLPGIPLGATHAYTKQHQTTGLQCPYEGPFKIDSQPSKSTVKLIVGYYKSGEERYEIRHLDDLKFAHPESLAAPASRPALGRPATVQVESPTTPGPSHGDKLNTGMGQGDKLNTGLSQGELNPGLSLSDINPGLSRTTPSSSTSSSGSHPNPPSVESKQRDRETEPAQIQKESRLPARSTRNKNWRLELAKV